MTGRRSISSKSLTQKQQRLFFNRGAEFVWAINLMIIFNALEFCQFVAKDNNTHVSHYKLISMINSAITAANPASLKLRTVLLLLLRIRSAHLEILGFPIADGY